MEQMGGWFSNDNVVNIKNPCDVHHKNNYRMWSMLFLLGK